MTKNRAAADNTDFALDVLKKENLPVGAFISSIDEGDDTFSYLFKSELSGYVDWRWSVTVFQPQGAQPTLSEFVLLPGTESLIAPDWVPWSERLADYKALQLELERQAALDAEEAGEGEDADESEDEGDDIELVEIDEDETGGVADSEEDSDLLAAESNQSEDSEDDSEDTGKRPPRSRGRSRRGNSKKSN